MDEKKKWSVGKIAKLIVIIVAAAIVIAIVASMIFQIRLGQM